MSVSKRLKIALIINLAVGVLSIGSWVFMALLNFDGNALTSNGLSSLKYFTVLSNLFNGVVALIYAGALLKRGQIGRALKIVKLMAVSAVGLTFVTVMAFLGPVYGYGMMLSGPNLWMHLFLPVASLVSFSLLECDNRLNFRHTFFAVIPPALYATGYLTNIFINGIGGEWPNTNDFYSFLAWGNAVGAGIAIGIMIVTWVIAVVLYLLGRINILRWPDHQATK